MVCDCNFALDAAVEVDAEVACLCYQGCVAETDGAVLITVDALVEVVIRTARVGEDGEVSQRCALDVSLILWLYFVVSLSLHHRFQSHAYARIRLYYHYLRRNRPDCPPRSPQLLLPCLFTVSSRIKIDGLWHSPKGNEAPAKT